MRLSKVSDKEMRHGRIIARAMNELKVEQKKNMMKAVQDNRAKLEQAAETELFK